MESLFVLTGNELYVITDMKKILPNMYATSDIDTCILFFF